MNRNLPLALGSLMLGLSTGAHAQRYLNEVFTDAQITVTEDIIYGTNIDFLTSNLGSPLVPQDVVALQTAVATGQPIPPAYFNPADGSTGLKVTNVQFDLYEPDQSVDSEDARPLVIYLHTGNALPPGLNQAPTGSRKDPTVQAICSQLAKRGYVASAMSYRLGWNPLAATEEERRAQLLNAIYRALHDVREHVRVMKALADGDNTYAIDPTRIIVLGEGTGGYISLANATLDRGEELFIEKFRPDPFDETTSYVDTLAVGGLAGTDGALNLYKPNGFDFSTHFCVNLGGALADTSWLEPGDVPMVSFHTVFDPFAPFTEGIVIVPTTQGPVVEVQGSNLFIQLANQYGNNASFANLPNGDPYTDRARSMYGQTYSGVTVNTGAEGLFPMLRPVATPPNQDEASPWQYWDPNSPIAQSPSSVPGLTIHQTSLLSNPDMSEAKALTYIDSIMGYMNPRIVCALDLGPCLAGGETALVQVIHNSADAAASVVDVYLNGELAINDFAFRTATEFLALPAEEEIVIGIAPGNSTGAGDIIASFPFTLAADETYIVVANGIVSASGYTPDQPFDLYAVGGRTEAQGPGTDVLVFHGSTDAPTVQVAETDVLAGAVIVPPFSYGDFAGYLEVPAADYVLEVQLPDGTPVVAYDAPLATLGLDGAAITVLASGFLDPSVNSNGPSFGLWVALAAGGDLIPLPLATNINEEDGLFNGLRMWPNPAENQVFLAMDARESAQATMTITDMAGRVVRSLDLGVARGESQVVLELGDLSNGSYVLSIFGNQSLRSLPLNIVR